MSESTNPEKTLEEIMAIVDKELDIDVNNIGAEALRQVKIFSVIQALYVDATRKLEKLIIKHEAMRQHRYRYYAGKLPAEAYVKEPLRESVLKGDIDGLLKIDAKVVTEKLPMQEQERIVNYLEEAKWRLKSRGEELRLALDFQKLQLGL